MPEWRKIGANGLPNEGRSPKSGHRMATEGMQLPWRWNGGTIPLNLGVIWEMSVYYGFLTISGGSYKGQPDDVQTWGLMATVVGQVIFHMSAWPRSCQPEKHQSAPCICSDW